ncbi:hypothetical protein Trydic_g10757 [Trypoxylus dichotomus]
MTRSGLGAKRASRRPSQEVTQIQAANEQKHKHWPISGASRRELAPVFLVVPTAGYSPQSVNPAEAMCTG